MRISDWSSDVCSSDLVLRAQLVEAHGLSDGAATFIHEYRRFQQQNFFRAKPPLGDPALKLLLRRRKAMHIRNDIGSHKPDIVPVERILSARIAESCPDLHDFIVPLSERRKLFPAFLFAFSRRDRKSTRLNSSH